MALQAYALYRTAASGYIQQSDGYSIEINPPETIVSATEWESYNVQRVTVVIKRNDRELLTVSDNKIGGAI